MNDVYQPANEVDSRNKSNAAASVLLNDLRHKLFRGGRLTKVNGITGSIAPEASQLGAGLMLALGASLAGLGFSSSAEAGGCAITLPGTVSCSGPANPATDPQAYYPLSVPLTATTSADFGIETKAGGAAFDLRGVGGVSLIHLGSGSIKSSNAIGVYLNNQGSGDTVFTSVGDVVGKSKGLDIVSGAGTGDVTVKVGNVESNGGLQMDAIHLEHSGTGNVAVNSTGTLSAKGGADGLFISNTASGHDITVNARHGDARRQHGRRLLDLDGCRRRLCGSAGSGQPLQRQRRVHAHGGAEKLRLGL